MMLFLLIFIGKKLKGILNIKNRLAENMMRFETKNQYQTDKIFF